MTDETKTSRESAPRDAPFWASQTDVARLSAIPEGARNLNVEGKRMVGPLQGFGPMWQKTYQIRLEGVDVAPEEVIKAWKDNFPHFWPPRNYFYAPLTGIAPGEVALINSSLPGGMPLSTGVLVLYSDDESFTLMTTQGHPFSGWVTFSARREPGKPVSSSTQPVSSSTQPASSSTQPDSGEPVSGSGQYTVAQAQVLMRANDPIYAVGMRMGGHRQEDKLWQHTLRSLATHLGATGEVQTDCVCVDPRIQWSRAKNIWHNAGIRSTLHLVASPVLQVRRAIRDSRPAR